MPTVWAVDCSQHGPNQLYCLSAMVRARWGVGRCSNEAMSALAEHTTKAHTKPIRALAREALHDQRTTSGNSLRSYHEAQQRHDVQDHPRSQAAVRPLDCPRYRNSPSPSSNSSSNQLLWMPHTNYILGESPISQSL